MVFSASIALTIGGGHMSPGGDEELSLKEQLFQRGARAERRRTNYAFLVCGPTGAGKSSVVDKLQGITIVGKEMTRESRRVDARNHTHLSRDEFRSREAAGHYLFSYEVPFVFDESNQPALYGVPRTVIDDLLVGDVVITLNDPLIVERACAELRKADAEVVPILITPKTSSDLEERIAMRFSSKEDRDRRRAITPEQHKQHIAMAQSGKYNHVIFNNTVNREREVWDQVRNEWLEHDNEVWKASNALVKLRTDRITTSGVKLSQIIAFYQALRGKVTTTNVADVLNTYVGFCCYALFGEPDIDVVRLKAKKGHLRFVSPHFNPSPTTYTGGSDYIRSKYTVTDIEVPRIKRLILKLNRRVDDRGRFDAYLHQALGSLGNFSTDAEGTRIFRITDRCYDINTYAGLEIRYTPLQRSVRSATDANGTK